MLKKYFITNISIMLILNLLVKPVWIFLIDRNVQLKLGNEEYGLYTAIVSLTIIFNILLDLGITNYNNKHLAAQKSNFQNIFPNIIIAKLLLSIAYFAVIITVAFVLKYSGRAFELILLLGCVQMLNSLLLYLRSNVSAHQDFVYDSIFSILDKLLMILLCSILLFSHFEDQFTIEWFIYAQLAAYFTSCFVTALFIVFKYGKFKVGKIKLAIVFQICKQSLPYAMLILMMAIYMRVDSLMLERMDSAYETGLYVEAFRILDACNMIAFLFAGILLPMFSRLLSQQYDIESIVITSTNLMLGASLALVSFCTIYASDIMQMLYHRNHQNTEWIFIWVIAAFPAYCLMYIYSTLLTANGNILLLIKIAIIGCIIAIAGNYIFIPHFHAQGVAVVSVVVEWSVASLYIIYCIKIFKLSVSFTRVFKFVTLFLVLFIINLILHYYGFHLFIAAVFNFILFLILVYALRIWDKQIIKSYINQYIQTKNG